MINVSGWLEGLAKGVLEALGSAGDPVDLGTGRFTYSQSDLTLGGFIPIEAQRAYNSGDGRARPFGMGTMGTYDTFLTSKKQWQELDLNLIDGTQVHYVRTSGGKGYPTRRSPQRHLRPVRRVHDRVERSRLGPQTPRRTSSFTAT